MHFFLAFSIANFVFFYVCFLCFFCFFFPGDFEEVHVLFSIFYQDKIFCQFLGFFLHFLVHKWKISLAEPKFL